MSYFAFLFWFVGLPILLLLALTRRDKQQQRELPPSLTLLPPEIVILLLAVVALLYTTPWDNYLVATRVWWYDPALVTGITLGWVPIEEYTFFILQTLLTGLWLLFLARRLPVQSPFQSRPALRTLSTAAVALLWLGSLFLLLSGWLPGTYLALELVWALPPIALQLAVGADILWHYRRPLVAALISAALYLSFADSLAIGSGTWTINPEQSLGWMLGGVLPIEEALFFLLTNTLLVFGMILALARESYARLPHRVVRALPLSNPRPIP